MDYLAHFAIHSLIYQERFSMLFKHRKHKQLNLVKPCVLGKKICHLP